MSLDVTKLEHVHHTQKDGEDVIIARCPACAEEGGDNTGNHLIIFSDERFGCVVNPTEDEDTQEHRQRIFQLVGIKGQAAKPPRKARFKPLVKMASVQKQVRVFPLRKRPLPEGGSL